METSPESFYQAVGDSNWMKLTLSNWIVDSTEKTKQQFKVEIHLTLECMHLDQKQITLPWVAEEVFEFSPDPQLLLTRGVKAAQKVAESFLTAYKQANPESKKPFVLFVL